MIKSIKNRMVIAFAYGVYQLLICLFFGTFRFLPSEPSTVNYLIIVFCAITILEFLILQILVRKKGIADFNKVIFVFSFLISGIIGGTIVWFFSTTELANYFIHLSSFIIASLLPTVLYFLYFIYKDAETRISEMGTVSLKNSSASELVEEKIFHLENDNGKLLLEVQVNKIICYEANDNYVVTYYLDKNDQLKKSMERVALKKIEEMLTKEGVVFYRVHKSYLINPIYVEEIKGKAQAYKIQLKNFDGLVPVSRSYDISLIGR